MTTQVIFKISARISDTTPPLGSNPASKNCSKNSSCYYGVATISRLFENVGLFGRISSLL